MSFRTAYFGLKSSRRTSRPQGYLCDPTPEEWRRKMDEYYRQEQQRKNGR
jgi:hypothetical protein